MNDGPPRNAFDKFMNSMIYLLDAPVTWTREKIVANRPKYYYYHRQFRRVPTIDMCDIGDILCFYEAEEQFKRDRDVDTEILHLLRSRKDDCIFYEAPDHEAKCSKVIADYEEASVNWFIKYGDLSAFASTKDAYMKQKHRMIWERRQAQKKKNAIQEE